AQELDRKFAPPAPPAAEGGARCKGVTLRGRPCRQPARENGLCASHHDILGRYGALEALFREKFAAEKTGTASVVASAVPAASGSLVGTGGDATGGEATQRLDHDEDDLLDDLLDE